MASSNFEEISEKVLKEEIQKLLSNFDNESDDHGVIAINKAIQAFNSLKELNLKKRKRSFNDHFDVPPEFRCPISNDAVVFTSGQALSSMEVMISQILYWRGVYDSMSSEEVICDDVSWKKPKYSGEITDVFLLLVEADVFLKAAVLGAIVLSLITNGQVFERYTIEVAYCELFAKTMSFKAAMEKLCLVTCNLQELPSQKVKLVWSCFDNESDVIGSAADRAASFFSWGTTNPILKEKLADFVVDGVKFSVLVEGGTLGDKAVPVHRGKDLIGVVRQHVMNNSPSLEQLIFDVEKLVMDMTLGGSKNPSSGDISFIHRLSEPEVMDGEIVLPFDASDLWSATTKIVVG